MLCEVFETADRSETISTISTPKEFKERVTSDCVPGGCSNMSLTFKMDVDYPEAFAVEDFSYLKQT
jgi:hypothetical protein